MTKCHHWILGMTFYHKANLLCCCFLIHKNVLNRTNYNFSQLENTDYTKYIQ